MANTNLVVIFGPGYLNTSAGPIFVCPASSSVSIQRMVVNNHATTTTGLNIFLVRSNDTVSQAHTNVVGGPNNPYPVTTATNGPTVIASMAATVLVAGDTLWAQATVNNALTIYGSGWQINNG